MARRIFLDNPPGSKIPTLNEYLAQRAAEEQEQYYLQGSRNRKESYPLVKKYTDEEIEQAKKEKENAKEEYINAMQEATIAYSKAHNISPVLAAIELSKENLHTMSSDTDANRYLKARRLLNDRIRQDIYIEKPLANCIATATSNNPNPGHFVTGNQTFRANPGKYGWKEVKEEEIKPGGLMQYTDAGYTPDHSVILDHKDDKGLMFVNYSPGSYPIYQKNVEHWNPYKTYYYNFVGNSADSTRWTNEYNKRYRKLNGGVLNKRHSLKYIF